MVSFFTKFCLPRVTKSKLFNGKVGLDGKKTAVFPPIFIIFISYTSVIRHQRTIQLNHMCSHQLLSLLPPQYVVFWPSRETHHEYPPSINPSELLTEICWQICNEYQRNIHCAFHILSPAFCIPCRDRRLSLPRLLCQSCYSIQEMDPCQEHRQDR